MTLFDPKKYKYDYQLGIDVSGHHIDYIKESHVVQSRISSTRCYLIRYQQAGQSMGYDTLLPLNNFIESSPLYRAQAWPSGSLPKPSTNPEANSRAGAIYVYIDGVAATRVMDINDLLDDDEFVVVERQDLEENRVEIVFNSGFNPTAHSITWKYTSMNEGVTNEMLKRGDAADQSLFGWSQYTNNCYDDYQGRHQILVRMPLVIRDLVINEEGKVTLEENESWTIWTPYIKDFDILVVPSTDSPTGEEMRFEIVNKRDSVIQRTLISQRFKLKYLEPSDPRYDVPIITDISVESLQTEVDTTLWRYIACDLIYDEAYKTYVHTDHNT